MKSIKVRITGKFKVLNGADSFEGKDVIIDRIKGSPSYHSGIGMRVVNVWVRPQWYDAGWFDFEEGKAKWKGKT